MMEMVGQTKKYEAAYFRSRRHRHRSGGHAGFLAQLGRRPFLELQAKPATEWEQRIDELMARQVASFDEAERVRLFTDVQKIFAEHEPRSTSPRRACSSPRRLACTGLTPSLIRPQLLWSADTIAVVR